MLVTVDDLPLTGAALEADFQTRLRTTKRLLAVLKRHRIQAVGLVTWSHVKTPNDEKLLSLWLDGGHELGSHGDAHLDFSKTPTEAYLSDVEAGHAKLAAFLESSSRHPRFFRFPYLREGDTRDKHARAQAWLVEHGLRNLPVTIDDQDWSFETPWVEARRTRNTAELSRLEGEYQQSLRLSVAKYTSDGDALFSGTRTPQILLLHATEVGAAQWETLFTWLEKQGFRFATADEVTSHSAINEPHDFIGSYGGSLWGRIAHTRWVTRAALAGRALLDAQVETWNRGDLPGFTDCYADDAVMVTPSGLTRGRTAILKRYQSKYSTAARMGTLALEVVETRPSWGPEVTMLGDATPGRVHGLSVVAKWTVTPTEGKPASGYTLLTLERRGSIWRIVHDASM
jgi:uncharacterized protein (TIGR02246 family)